MNRIEALTGIRCFAALWVVLLHFRANLIVADTVEIDWLASRGFWGVDIFFVLSGFILTYTYQRNFTSPEFGWTEYTHFLFKRLARIYPLHLFSFLIFAALAFITSHYGLALVNMERSQLETVLPNLFLLHAWGITDALSWNYPSWSISAEWFAYLALLFLGARTLWKRDIKHTKRVVIYSWLALCLWTGLQGNMMNHFTTNAILRIIPEFLAGCLLYRMASAGVGSKWGSWGTIVGAGGILLLAQVSRNFEFLLLPLIGVLILSLYHGSRLGQVVFANRAVVFLGEVSYSIYLLHSLAAIAGDQLVGFLDLAPSVTLGWVVLTGEVTLSVVFGIIGYYLVEQPARRALVGWYERRRQTELTRTPVTSQYSHRQ